MKLQYLNSATVLITTETTKFCATHGSKMVLIMVAGAIIQKLKRYRHR